jgi:uncharacterized protein YdaU (DUF1376 family)
VTRKVRRIDWSPDEWLGGTTLVLTVEETGVYMTALMVIYSRGGHCPNDAAFIAGHFKRPPSDHGRSARWHVRQVRAALDQLIELGKLNPTPDGKWLTNGRANDELSKAGERIVGAARAGIASGRARRAKTAVSQPSASREPAVTQRELLPLNDLSRTSVRNHQPSYESESESVADTSADAARARGSSAASRAHGSDVEAMTPGKLPTMAERLAAMAQASRGQQQQAAAPKPKSKSAERLEALAAEARAKFLKGAS